MLLSLCVESLENPFEFKSKHKSNFFAMDTALQEGYMRYRSILDSISAAGDELKKNYLSESGAGTITKIKLGRASTKNQEVFSILKAAAMSDPTGAASKVLNNTLKSALEKYRKQPGDEKVVSPTDCF